MSVIETVENEIISQVKAVLMKPGEEKVKLIDTLPGAWSFDLLKRLLQKAPSVYVAFLGGPVSTPSGDLANIKAKFDVYVVSKEADEETRRRGNKRVIGCYDMLATLVPQLHGYTVPDVGSLMLTNINNLFGQDVYDLGGTVYAATFEIPNMVFEPEAVTLNDFETFYSKSSLADDAPVTETEITLTT